MFLVSGPDLVAAVSNAGGMGTFASMSYRTLDDLKEAILTIRSKTAKPFGMNIVMHKAHNPLWQEQLQVAVDEKIPLIIFSMGTPRSVIRDLHKEGHKVFCDVVTAKQAQIVAKAGADAVVAVSQGAGGHAGQTSPFALVLQVKEATGIPVLAAGSISRGEQMAAAFCLGADAVYIGTRFIASEEAHASGLYKEALLAAQPDDIIYSDAISGVSANWLRQSYDLWLKQEGLNQEGLNQKENKTQPDPGTTPLKKWIDIWSAGHGVAQIHEVLPVSKIIDSIISQYRQVKQRLP